MSLEKTSSQSSPTLEEVSEAITRGVLRAVEARQQGGSPSPGAGAHAAARTGGFVPISWVGGRIDLIVSFTPPELPGQGGGGIGLSGIGSQQNLGGE